MRFRKALHLAIIFSMMLTLVATVMPTGVSALGTATVFPTSASFTPTAVVALHRAVVVAEVHGPRKALDLIDGLSLAGYYLFHAIRADLLRRLGRLHEATAAYESAIEHTDNADSPPNLEDVGRGDHLRDRCLGDRPTRRDRVVALITVPESARDLHRCVSQRIHDQRTCVQERFDHLGDVRRHARASCCPGPAYSNANRIASMKTVLSPLFRSRAPAPSAVL